MNIFELAAQANDEVFEQLILSESKALETLDQVDEKKNSPLFYAIKAGNLKMVQFLIQKGVGLHTDKYTPFILACYYGHEHIAAELMTKNALKERDIYGTTPLIHAAWNGHTKLVQSLIKQGADYNAVNMHGDSALHIALRMKHPETAQKLLEYPNIATKHKNILGYDPFALALVNGYVDIAESLYDNKTNVKQKYTENNSLLHMCAIAGTIESAQWLLKHGADPRWQNMYRLTPLALSAYHGHTAMASLLIQNCKQDMALIRNLEIMFIAASQQGHKDIAELVLSYKHKFSSVFKQFVLMNAAIHGHWDIMATVLDIEPKKVKKRINKIYNYGNYEYNHKDTLLHAAAEKGHLEVVQNLVARGAKLSAKNQNGDTILHNAVRSGNVDVVRWICNQKVYVNHKNEQGNSPLHLAIKINNIEMVRCLLVHGANYVLENNNKESSEFLAKAQPSISQCISEFKERNFKNFNLPQLHFAASARQDKSILEVLPIFHDLNQLSKDGQTPLQLAAHLGNFCPMVILFLVQANGDKQLAIQLAENMKHQYYSRSRAYSTINSAILEIQKFPQERLEGILLLCKNLEEEKQNNQELRFFKHKEKQAVEQKRRPSIELLL